MHQTLCIYDLVFRANDDIALMFVVKNVSVHAFRGNSLANDEQLGLIARAAHVIGVHNVLLQFSVK
jgi:hypothetical protein